MIQDIGFSAYDNNYKARNIEESDSVFIFRGREVLVKMEGDKVSLPKYKDIILDKDMTLDKVVYLFEVDKTPYYLAVNGSELNLAGYEFANMNLIRTMKPQTLAFATMTAFHLFNWYRTNHYCGCCRGEMLHSEKERALKCDGCGNMVFPRISPAVIVGITNGNKILMTKYAGRDYKKYALVAGFCEIGETAERTVEREVMEEVGIKVKNIRYYKSQPWGLAGDLLLGYFAEVDGDTTITIDETELAEGTWIDRDDIEFEEDCVTLTSEMIMHFKKNN